MKIVIEIHDNPDGTVTAKATPNFAQLRKNSLRPPTPAEAYAVAALLAIRDMGRERVSPIILPPGLNGHGRR